jgi:hypothetical protein
MKKVAKIGAHSTIVVPEQIELQAFRQRYLRKPLAAELRQYRSNRIRCETVAKQKRHEWQPLVYGQCHAPRTFLNQFGHYGLEHLDFGRPGGLVVAPRIRKVEHAGAGQGSVHGWR